MGSGADAGGLSTGQGIGLGLGAVSSLIGGGAAGRASQNAALRQRRFFQGQVEGRSRSRPARRLRILLGLPPGVGSTGKERRSFRERQGQIESQGFADNPLAASITQSRLEGAQRGIQRGGQALSSSLARSGVGGGLGAQALGQFERQAGASLGGIRAQEGQLANQFDQQQISNLQNTLQIFNPGAGGAVQGLGSLLGQPGPQGQDLIGLGQTLGVASFLPGLLQQQQFPQQLGSTRRRRGSIPFNLEEFPEGF